MAARNPLESFIWGAGGEALSPGQVAERRRIASELAAKEVPGLGHWAATLNQGLTGFLSGRERRMADEGETAGRQGFQSQWDSIFSGGGSPVAAALAGPQATGSSIEGSAASGAGGDFISALVNSESGGNWNALNNEGYGGRLQFGAARLADAAKAGIIPAGVTGAAFSQMSPEQQQAVEAWHFNDIDQQAARMGLDKYYGQTIAGVPINQNSIRSMAHLGGIGGAQKFITSGGQYNPADSNGTRLSTYGTRFGGMGGGSASPQLTQAGGGQPSVAQLLSLAGNEWANPGQSNVINALLDQQIEQQDPAYQLSRQKTELEIQKLLNPEAPAPVFEGGRWWDRSGGVPTPLTDPTVSPTSGMQNYDFLISQGVSPQDAAARAFSGGVTVNTGNQGPQVGTIPPSMALVADPTNPTGYRMETIPGSPEAIAAEQAAAAAEIGTENTGRTANIVREDLGRIRDIVNNAPWFNPAVGFGADVAQAVAGSNATNVAALSKTVLANIGFDRLQQMRDASPTGGALGAISDRELGTLQSVMGNLEQSQSVDQFMYNLDRLGTIYDEILTKASAYPNASAFGIQAPSGTEEQQTYPNAPAVGALVEGYRFKGGDPAVMENWEMVQ